MFDCWWVCLLVYLQVFIEASDFANETEEITARTVLEHEVRSCFRLERVVEFHDEGVIDAGENAALDDELAELRVFRKQRFLNDFHRVESIVIVFLHEDYLAKAALAQHEFQ